MYYLAFLSVFAIFMMTELTYDVSCSAGNQTAEHEVLSLFDCLRQPEECLFTFLTCHWAELATLLCVINNIIDEFRQVSDPV